MRGEGGFHFHPSLPWLSHMCLRNASNGWLCMAPHWEKFQAHYQGCKRDETSPAFANKADALETLPMEFHGCLPIVRYSTCVARAVRTHLVFASKAGTIIHSLGGAEEALEGEGGSAGECRRVGGWCSLFRPST